MMVSDVVPPLPQVGFGEFSLRDFDEVVKELERGSNLFLFYESSKGELELLFEDLAAPLYACMVTKLSQPNQQKVYEFLKLVLEAVYQVKKCNKKGWEMAGRIEEHIAKRTKKER